LSDWPTPTLGSGTVGNTSATFNGIRPAGGNLIVEVTATAAYTGTFNGTSTLHGILIIHTDGSANFHDVEIFTGTVNGVPGTVTPRPAIAISEDLRVSPGQQTGSKRLKEASLNHAESNRGKLQKPHE